MAIDLNREHVTTEYAKLASNYDSKWSVYIDATTEETVRRLPISIGATLDVGCGTGALLAQLIQRFPNATLTGVDASTEMLEHARSRLPDEVKLHACWAEELPFDDASFDTIVSCNMFHFIRRPEVALAEMMRVLRPAGTVVITDWCHDFLSCKLSDFYLRWFDRSHFRTYGESQCRELLAAVHARHVQVDRYKVTWLWGMMTAIARKELSAAVCVPD